MRFLPASFVPAPPYGYGGPTQVWPIAIAVVGSVAAFIYGVITIRRERRRERDDDVDPKA